MKQVKDQSIADTGERMIPAYHKSNMVYGEHIVRYQAAADLVKGKTVLDIASGSGYGSALLAATASRVYGVDVDQDAIDYANKNYKSDQVEFLKGDGRKIPLEDGSVDVVVSFETIEHIEDYNGFMREVKRVLKTDGLFILSTPNDVEFPEGAHFHIHEFEHQELKRLVAKYFKNTKEYFQVTWLYNALLDEPKISGEWQAEISTMNTAPVKTDKAIYFYMLCSNRQIKEIVEPLGAISQHWSERQGLEHNAEIDKYIKDTINHYEGILSEKDKQIARHIEQVQALNNELFTIKNSAAWRTIKKLGAAKKKVKNKRPKA